MSALILSLRVAKIVCKTEGKSTSNDAHLPNAEMHIKSSLSTAYSQQIFYGSSILMGISIKK